MTQAFQMRNVLNLRTERRNPSGELEGRKKENFAFGKGKMPLVLGNFA